MHKFTERNQIDFLAPADSNPLRTSTYYPMAQFREFIALINSAAITDGATVKAQLLQAQDAGGTGSKALTTELTLTAVGAVAVNGKLSAYADKMDEGFTHVAVTLLASDAAGVAGATIIRTPGRYL